MVLETYALFVVFVIVSVRHLFLGIDCSVMSRLDKSRDLWRISPEHLLIIFIIALIIAIILLYLTHFQPVLGPIIGALISVIAVLSNDLAKYYSSTSTLRLSLGIGGENDSGLDVEVFNPTRRVSAMIINDGNTIIRDVKASLTIKVKKGNEEKYHLGDVLLRRAQFDDYKKKYSSIENLLNSYNCQNYLVNEINPHVIGETLPWALPEKIIPRPAVYFPRRIRRERIKELIACKDEDKINLFNLLEITCKSIKEVLDKWLSDELPMPWFFTDYQHITSISPGQRNRLLIFDYVKLSEDEYLVMPYSEYGGEGISDPSLRPYRACLRITKDTELMLEVTVHGEGSRNPLKFNLCIDFDKLNQLEKAIQCGGDYDQLLQALNKLKCQGQKWVMKPL